MSYNISNEDPRRLKLRGMRFGKLVAINPTDKRVGKAIVWKCKCDCGNDAYVLSYNLYRLNTQSCGCLNKSAAMAVGHANSKDKRYNPAINRLYGRYYKNCISTGRDFNLSKEDFVSIVTKDCNYCGIPPMQVANSSDKIVSFLYNGIDRVDSSKGYSLDNCVPCCKICNFAKKDMDLDSFMAWIRRLVTFQEKHNVK